MTISAHRTYMKRTLRTTHADEGDNLFIYIFTAQFTSFFESYPCFLFCYVSGRHQDNLALEKSRKVMIYP